MSLIVSNSAQTEIESLTTDQKRALIEAIRVLIVEELTESHEMKSCPRCESSHVVKRGKTQKGSQRWLCKTCDRSFSASTMSVLLQSKLSKQTWVLYAQKMIEGASLQKLSRLCGVSLKTAWFMRMRICEAMGKRLDPFRSGPGIVVEVDGTKEHESFCGNNTKGDFVLPRKPHKSAHGLEVRGSSGYQCCILCGINDRGDSFSELVGRAHANTEILANTLEQKLEPGTHLVTDDLKAYRKVAKRLGLTHEIRPSKSKQVLGMINALHRRLDKFLLPFYGVSTRRLPQYLSWFSWTEQFRKSDANMGELVAKEAFEGRYTSTRHMLFEAPRFDIEWWASEDERAVAREQSRKNRRARRRGKIPSGYDFDYVF